MKELTKTDLYNLISALELKKDTITKVIKELIQVGETPPIQTLRTKFDDLDQIHNKLNRLIETGAEKFKLAIL